MIKNQMKHKILISSFLMVFVFAAIDACKKKHRRGGGAPTIESTDNVTVSGTNVTLANNSTSQTSGFSLKFSNIGSLTCSNVSIVTTGAYAFVPNSSTFLPSPVEAAMPQYTCMQSGSNITLSSAPPLTEGFHPWVDNFNIILGTTTFNVSVNTPDAASQLLTRGDQSTMNLDSSFTGCGLRGTVLQRVFDCSKKIVNYGATVTAAQTSSNATGSTSGTYYTAFTNGADPDPYWFVVSCPAGTGGSVPQQSCHWLTPIVPADNPALDTAGTQTFTLALLTGYQKRLLFSGKMTNGTLGYDFGNANGLNAYGLPDAQTAQTYDLGTSPGAGATGPQPTPSPTTVCVALAGASLNSTYSATTFASNANPKLKISDFQLQQ